MSTGFGDNKIKVLVKLDEVDKILKQYKKVKKYMKSSLYTLKVIDGTENYVTKLIKESEDNG